jgi:hypothetical protein
MESQVLICRGFIISMLLLVGCGGPASHPRDANKLVAPSSPPPQSLEDALRADLITNLPNNYSTESKAHIANCVAMGIVIGIPPSDRSQMLAAYQSRRVSPEVDDLFIKWLGRSMLHGPIAEPDPTDPSTFQGGVLHYADGTPAKDADPARKASIRSNIQSVCPDLPSEFLD